MLDDLSVKVKVLHDWFIFFMSSFSWFCSWFFTFPKSMFFNNPIISDSKVASSFIGGGMLKLLNPYLCWLFFLFWCFSSYSFEYHLYFFYELYFVTFFRWYRDILCWIFKFKFLHQLCKVKVKCSTGFRHIYSSGKGYLLALQRVLNDSCEPEHWYIQNW